MIVHPTSRLALIACVLLGLLVGSGVGYFIATHNNNLVALNHVSRYHSITEQRARVYLDFLKSRDLQASGEIDFTRKALKSLTNYVTEVQLLYQERASIARIVDTNFFEQVRAYISSSTETNHTPIKKPGELTNAAGS